MRFAQLPEAEVDASASWSGDPLFTPYLTRASVTAVVTNTSSADGVLVLQGSNEKPTSYMMATHYEPSEASWANIPGASLPISANGTQTFEVEITYQYVRARYIRASGSADIAVTVHAKGWP